ncbi:hypothetical protein BRDCF_p1653 [Bacteroidales bacterium CF]|nr:hypothetical protein BRDCF_p1653 [Bacteroidales bacterium CF]
MPLSRLKFNGDMQNQGNFQPEGARSDYRYKAEKDLGFLVIL